MLSTRDENNREVITEKGIEDNGILVMTAGHDTSSILFDPTRFENQASIPPYCFIPLGGGPRICPGYEFARIETLVTIHHLVTRFTWKFLAYNFFERDPMPVPTKGLPIQIMPTL
uniref:Cytochrome P450 n=1 Tax=Populus trichocarpa TaxID=3694 RepID=A0A2K2CCE0_POPTR